MKLHNKWIAGHFWPVLHIREGSHSLCIKGLKRLFSHQSNKQQWNRKTSRPTCNHIRRTEVSDIRQDCCGHCAQTAHVFLWRKKRFSQSGMSLSQRTLGLFACTLALLEGVMLTDPLFALHMNPQQHLFLSAWLRLNRPLSSKWLDSRAWWGHYKWIRVPPVPRLSANA